MAENEVLYRQWVDFISKSSSNSSGCLEWNGPKTDNGYGFFNINGGRIRSHRFSYEVNKDKIPEGFQLDHLCRNRLCVNPYHLQAVSSKTNTLRGFGLSAINKMKTHCKRGHELKEPNLKEWDKLKGKRRCLICFKESDRRRYERRKKSHY